MTGSLELQVENAEDVPSPMGPQLVNFERVDIPAGETIEIVAKTVGGGSSNAGRWILIAAGIGLVVVIVFAIVVRKTGKSSNHTSEIEGEDVDDDVDERECETEDDADALVTQIAELDLRYERGEVMEQEYVQQRRDLKARLIRALKNEER